VEAIEEVDGDGAAFGTIFGTGFDTEFDALRVASLICLLLFDLGGSA